MTDYHISEIARFFGLAPSTLRYWEEQGLLSTGRDAESSYREYQDKDLMTISDIIFYKNLGLPLKQIKQMEEKQSRDHLALLKDKENDLDRQMQALQLQKQRVKKRIAALEELERLRQEPFQEAEIDTDCIVSFGLKEQNKLAAYIADPYLYSRVQRADNLHTEARGLTIPKQLAADFSGQVLWEKKPGKYLAFLLKEEVAPGFPNNLQAELRQLPCQPSGWIISRFLDCGEEDGRVYDYYKTFVEIS